MNAGIVPLCFANEADYDLVSQGDHLVLKDIRSAIRDNTEIILHNATTGADIPLLCPISGRSRDILLAGGLLNYTKQQA